jgi:hypothetical protein
VAGERRPNASDLKQALIDQLKGEVNARFGDNAILRGIARTVVEAKRMRESEDPEAGANFADAVFNIFEQEAIREYERKNGK